MATREEVAPLEGDLSQAIAVSSRGGPPVALIRGGVRWAQTAMFTPQAGVGGVSPARVPHALLWEVSGHLKPITVATCYPLPRAGLNSAGGVWRFWGLSWQPCPTPLPLLFADPFEAERGLLCQTW